MLQNQPNDLENLKAKINTLKHQKDGEKTNNIKLIDSAAELIAALFVGGIIGYLLDNFFTSKPLFFVICFTLGFIIAFYNIYRNLVK